MTAIGGAGEFERFEPHECIAQGDRVVALGTERGRVRANGRMFDNDWALVFRVREGRVASFTSYEDTAALIKAFGERE